MTTISFTHSFPFINGWDFVATVSFLERNPLIVRL